MSNLKIHLSKILQNFNLIKEHCRTNNIGLEVVTKCCGSDKNIVYPLIDEGAEIIVDSYPKNLKGIKRKVKKVLLPTSPSAIQSDQSLDFIHITDLGLLKKRTELFLSKSPQIIIPLEMGDLREGVPGREAGSLIREAMQIKNVGIAGVSANWGCGCFKDKQPDTNWLNPFENLIEQIRLETHFKPQIVSIGGSSLFSILHEQLLPPAVTHIRIGEAIFLGRDPGTQLNIPCLQRETFILEAEVLEVKWKNVDSRSRKRAVIACGYTSIGDATDLISIQKDVKVMDISQDYTVLDITEFDAPISAGDYIPFHLTYKGVSNAMLSPYIKKLYISTA